MRFIVFITFLFIFFMFDCLFLFWSQLKSSVKKKKILKIVCRLYRVDTHMLLLVTFARMTNIVRCPESFVVKGVRHNNLGSAEQEKSRPQSILNNPPLEYMQTLHTRFCDDL